jgi:hypothetical protein
VPDAHLPQNRTRKGVRGRAQAVDGIAVAALLVSDRALKLDNLLFKRVDSLLGYGNLLGV